MRISRNEKAPSLVTRADLKLMQPGSVIVDVAVDQGGCVETSRPTTHAEPVFTVDGLLHYCVTNMPGAVPRTATQALTAAMLPYLQKLVTPRWRDDSILVDAVNIEHGRIVHPALL